LFAFALILSVLALAAGLGLAAIGKDRVGLRLAVDGFILGVVPTLIAVRVVPHLWGRLGVWAVGLVAIGYGSFWLLNGRRTDSVFALTWSLPCWGCTLCSTGLLWPWRSGWSLGGHPQF